MKAISTEEYNELKSLYARHSAFVDTKRGRNGWASYKPEEVPENARISNEQIGAIEVYEFVNSPPDKYFLYIKHEPKQVFVGATGLATTFAGDVLGAVIFGRKYHCPGFSGFPSTRVPITVHAINGKKYFGTYYASSGSYARIKLAKRQ